MDSPKHLLSVAATLVTTRWITLDRNTLFRCIGLQPCKQL